MKHFYFLLLHLLFGGILAAQVGTSPKIDSLKSLLKPYADSANVMIYREIGLEYDYHNLDSALTMTRRGLEQARELKDPYLESVMLQSLGVVFFNSGQQDSAVTVHLQSLEIAREHNLIKQQGDNLNGLSNARGKQGRFQESIELLLEAEPLYESIRDTKMLAATNNNLAVAFRRIKEPELAIKYYKRAVKLYEELGDEFYVSIIYNNIGGALNDLLRYNEALENLTIARDRLIHLGYDRYTAYPLTNMAIAYDSLGQNTLAEKYYKEAIRLHTINRDPYELAFLHNALANFYYKKGDVNKAIKIGNKALEFADESGAIEFESTTSKTLSNSLASIGRYRDAHFHLSNHIMLNDSIFRLEKQEAIFNIQTKYETEKKEKEILLQRAEIAEQKTVIQKRTTAIVGAGALVFIVGLIGYLLYNNQRIKNIQLERENELQLAMSKIESQNLLNEQRLRISRDLHDNIGAQLTFVISSLDNLKYGFDLKEGLSDKLDNIGQYTRSTIGDLRDTIWAMNKSQITMDDLKARIFNFIEKAKTADQEIMYKIDISDSVKDQVFTSIQGMNIYRIVQESIHNAIKHASTAQISIVFKKVGGLLRVIVADDGVGFDQSAVELGSGLTNMNKRAQQINGSIDVFSMLDQGTRITLEAEIL